MNKKSNSNVATLWQKYAPYWHVCMFLLGALAFGIMWYGNVNAAVAQTNKNSSDIVTLQTEFAAMNQKISDIHDWVKAEHDRGAR